MNPPQSNHPQSNHPQSFTHRPRRLRSTPVIRDLVQETFIHPNNLIMPMFIHHGANIRQPIASMPDIFQLSIDNALKEIERYLKVGLRSIILFGIPEHKDAQGSDALNPNGILAQAIQTIKKNFPDLLVISDCCFCEYTDHGHCGHLTTPPNKTTTTQTKTTTAQTTYIIDNDATLESLGKQAVIHAQAGSDMIAPSGMMDGMVQAIRTRLDETGFSHLPIMSYAVKYSSAFYGPFREAAQSHMTFGDRKSYQMNPANAREALTEASLDIQQGADILMVKPALPYLDIIQRIRSLSSLPIAAYQVSGEYAMLKAAIQNGWLSEADAILETLTSIKRAGADMILSYFAYTFAKNYK